MVLRAKLVEESTYGKEGGSVSSASTINKTNVRLSKLSEADDIEAYLTYLWAYDEGNHVDKYWWVFKLAPQLTGKAQHANVTMSQEESGKYDELKAVMLQGYDIDEETYHQHFRAAARKMLKETNWELATCLHNLLLKWMKHWVTIEKLAEQMIIDHFLNTMPLSVRIWMSEKKSKTI